MGRVASSEEANTSDNGIQYKNFTSPVVSLKLSFILKFMYFKSGTFTDEKVEADMPENSTEEKLNLKCSIIHVSSITFIHSKFFVK